MCISESTRHAHLVLFVSLGNKKHGEGRKRLVSIHPRITLAENKGEARVNPNTQSSPLKVQ